MCNLMYMCRLLDHDHEDSLDTDMFNPAYKEAMKVQIISRLYESPAQVM